jgi:hypothetical protein
MTLALFVGIGLVLGVILGLIVAYQNRPQEKSSNVGGALKLVAGIASL